jgi:hypothetical protein
MKGTKQRTTNDNFHPAENAIARAVTVALSA